MSFTVPIINKTYDVVQYKTDRKLGRAGVIILTLWALVVASNVYGGYTDKQREIMDESKSTEISSILKALDLYYQDSSDFLENRYFPIAKCSNDLNSFDYEYTLRGELIGVKSRARSHPYIKSTGGENKFPVDPQGSYSTTLPANFACKQFMPVAEQLDNRYFDGFSYCNFDISSNPNCFLYTSSLIGDSYKLSYFSPFYNKFVVYSKFRGDLLQVKLF